VTLTFKLDLDTVIVNQRAKCLMSKLLSEKFFCPNTDTHTPGRSVYLYH